MTKNTPFTAICTECENRPCISIGCEVLPDRCTSEADGANWRIATPEEIEKAIEMMKENEVKNEKEN